MGEWRVQVSVRVSPERRTELEQCAGREKRTLANFGALLLEWAFEQFNMVGSTERLLKYKIRSASLNPQRAKDTESEKRAQRLT
jgi:hypothetical protein